MKQYKILQHIWENVMIKVLRYYLLWLICSSAMFGCSHSDLPSGHYSPLDVKNGDLAVRDISFMATASTVEYKYDWVLYDGKRVSSHNVVDEINQFLELENKYNVLSLRQIPAIEASWYWSPWASTSNTNAREKSYIRDEMVLVIGVNPTVCIVVYRPTEFSGVLGGTPTYDTTEWWGTARVMLEYGMADGHILPLAHRNEIWSYKTEIVVPSQDLIVEVDISKPGACNLGQLIVQWDYVRGNDKQYISFSHE